MTIPREKLAALCHKHNVESMYIFGSVLKGNVKKWSDVDILVTMQGSKRKLKADLKALFNRRIHLIDKKPLWWDIEPSEKVI